MYLPNQQPRLAHYGAPDLLRLVVLVLLLSIFSIGIYGQRNADCSCGMVVDQNGALVVGASVRDIKSNRTVVTDEQGRFELVGSRPGFYQIEVVASGFEPLRARLAFPGSEIITLVSQSLTERVTVQASSLAGSSEALETKSGSYQKLSAESLENARVFEFGEALRKLPGLVVRDEEGFGLRPNIGIRGTNPTRSSKVLLLEDGLPLAFAPYGDNASYYHPPVERFESVEVLKGSGQIEYGPVTVAGVVNYLTPNPTDKRTFTVGVSGGTRDYGAGNLLFTGRAKGTGLVFGFNRKQGEGARDNTRTGVTDVYAKAVRSLGANNVISMKASLLDEGSQVTYSGLTESEFRDNPRFNPFANDRFDGDRKGLAATHSIVVTPATSVTTSIYFNRFKRDWWRQSSNSSQRPNRLNLDPDCLSMSDLLTTCGNEGRLRAYRNFGVEPVLTTAFPVRSSRSELKLGGRLHFETQDRLQLNGAQPKSRDGQTVENNLRTTRAASAFVHERIIIGDLAVTFGARIEKIRYQRTNRLNGTSGVTDITQVIPGAGVTYNLFGNSTVFAGVHRGFAPPRVEDIISSTGGVVDLDAELSWNYEAGIRSRPYDSFAFDLSVFRTNYENQIVPASIAGGVGAAFTNGGKTLHQGLEATARFDSARAFASPNNFYLQVSYTSLAVSDFRGSRFSSVPGFGGVAVGGNRLPYAPRHTLNAMVGFSRGPLDLFLENNSITRQFTDDLNTADPIANGQRGAIPGQTYWNSTLNFRVERLKGTFFVTVKNLGGSLFIVDRSRGILPSAPRAAQAGLKFRF